MDQVTLNSLCKLLPNIDFRQTYGMSECGILRVKSKSRNNLYIKIGGEGIKILKVGPDSPAKRAKLKRKDIQTIRKCVLKTIHWTKSDKGQSVITNNKSLILHENEKGTDNLIKRLLKNKKLNENSYLFIKINKIHQDKRIDLPTIGYKTVNYLVKSNIKYIILQADSTIILNKKKIFKLIKKFKKTIISVNINYFPHNNNCYIEF